MQKNQTLPIPKKSRKPKNKDLNTALEAKISDLTSQLALANAELEDLSYAVSHDLKAPIRAIEGFSRILIEDYSNQLDLEAKRYLSIIIKNTKNINQLIEDLLAFSRVSAAKIEKAQIDMTSLAQSAFCEETQVFSNRKINFQLSVLPEAYGDLLLIRRVFTSLISNSVKFTRHADVPAIKIGCEITQNERIYSINDNGVGFDMIYSGKLFGIFQRLHTVDEFEGTGIGLAIAHRIIARHGGRIWFNSKINEGTTFYFVIPNA